MKIIIIPTIVAMLQGAGAFAAPEEAAPVQIAAPSEIPAIQQEAPEDKNQAEIKIGRIDFSNAAASDKGHATQVKIGKRTNSQVKLYRDQVFGKHVIGIDTNFQAGVMETVHIAYFVVFQNSAGNVIGSASGTDEIEPGEGYGWSNSAVIPLPEKRFAEITYYQVVLYESDKPVGTIGAEAAPEAKEN